MLTVIGQFKLARNGEYRLTLTPVNKVEIDLQYLSIIMIDVLCYKERRYCNLSWESIKMTFKEFWDLPEEEQQSAFSELSSKDKMLVRQQQTSVGTMHYIRVMVVNFELVLMLLVRHILMVSQQIL